MTEAHFLDEPVGLIYILRPLAVAETCRTCELQMSDNQDLVL